MAFMANPTGGGDFVPFVKYNAKAGRWKTKKDEKDAPEFEVQDMTAIFDLDNLQTGWFLFAAGVAPAKTMDPSLAEAAPCPGEGHKRGFQVEVYSEKNLLGKREFASTAGVVIEAMNDLHDDWLANKDANPGKLPVVKCVGVNEIVGTHGTNYRPVLEIVAWADRPADMPGVTGAASPAPALVTPAPAPAAQEHAAPPAAPAPAPAPAAASEEIQF